MSALLDEIAQLVARPAERGERGMVDGRRSSTPVARQSPVDLDKLDADLHARAVMQQWAQTVRSSLPQRQHWRPARDTLREHWDWAVAQPWGPTMVAELEGVREMLVNGGRKVAVIECPVCRLPTRIDRLVTEHRDCLATVPIVD